MFSNLNIDNKIEWYGLTDPSEIAAAKKLSEEIQASIDWSPFFNNHSFDTTFGRLELFPVKLKTE